jgi:hypothetical protein
MCRKFVGKVVGWKRMGVLERELSICRLNVGVASLMSSSFAVHEVEVAGATTARTRHVLGQ